MKSFYATATLFIDQRRSYINRTKDKEPVFPVKIRVTYNRQNKLYRVGYSFTVEEFSKIMDPNSHGHSKTIRGELNAILTRAQDVIQDLEEFSFDKFEKRYLNGIKKQTNLVIAFDQHIQKLKETDQYATASIYTTAKGSLLKYRNNANLEFSDITPSFLQGYEVFLHRGNYSPTTISINTRCIRRLFNIAIHEETIKADIYPFGNTEAGKYAPPKHINYKRALNKEIIKKLFEYISENETELFYRDIWLFSYLCNGMNLADILRLKYSNLDGEDIYFIRHKTAHSRSLKPVVVSLTDHIKKIIDRWGAKPIKKDKYIFDILKRTMTAELEVKHIKQTTKQANKYIKQIAEKLGLNEKITTYTARHSFATILKNSGEDVAYISEALGHSNIKTTENYLSAFDDERRKKAAKHLTDW